MIAVFAGFIGSSESMIKMIGFGLAIAVLFDAFVVRMAIVPAVLALLGKRGLVAAALAGPAAAERGRGGRGAHPPDRPDRHRPRTPGLDSGPTGQRPAARLTRTEGRPWRATRAARRPFARRHATMGTSSHRPEAR